MALRAAMLLALVAAAGLALLPAAGASPSCCTKHLMPFIPDPSVAPPEFDELGQPRRIVDPNPENVRPEEWDDDDDGPWEPNEMDNRDFAWKPPLMANPDFKPPELIDSLQTEILKAVPWVVMGVLVTAALEAAQLSVSALREHLQGAGVVQGALIGLATPLCSCGALPVAAGFVSSGVPLRVVVAFLTATQSAGLDSAAITWGLLGPTAALCRLAGAVVLSVAASLAVPSHASALATSAAASNDAPKSGEKKRTTSWLAALASSVVGTAADVFPSVLLGLCLSTVALHYAPHLATTYASLKACSPSPALGGPAVNSLLTRLFVLTAALPLQLCEQTTVAYAAAIQKAGGPPGLAFAFLLVAPATNLPSLLLLFRAKHANSTAKAAAWRVAAALTIGALVLSYAVDLLGLDLLVEKEADQETEGMMALPEWYVRSSPWVAAALALTVMPRMAQEKLGWGGGEAKEHSDGCCDGHGDSDGKTKVA